MKRLLMAVVIGLIVSGGSVYAKSEALYGAKEIVVQESTDGSVKTHHYSLIDNSGRMAIAKGKPEAILKRWDAILEDIGKGVQDGSVEILKHDNTFGVETIYFKEQSGTSTLYSAVQRNSKQLVALSLAGSEKDARRFGNYLEANGISSFEVIGLQLYRSLNDLENIKFEF